MSTDDKASPVEGTVRLPDEYLDHHKVVWWRSDGKRCTSWLTNAEIEQIILARSNADYLDEDSVKPK